MRKLLLIFHTVIHLKLIQIRFQFWYRIRRYVRKIIGFKYALSVKKEGHLVALKPFIKKYNSFSEYQFTFINQSKTFSKNDINWNYSEYGKLWTYNLNYFDFLNQEEVDPETGLKLIDDYISNLNQYSPGLEPYPIALRGINWIKFLNKTYISLQEHPKESSQNIT